MSVITLSHFRCDVTPPLGHPLCGGWIAPATEIVDRQWANGVILAGDEPPVVLVAVDWCEIRNEGHDQWRQAIAEAAGTPVERVAVHCVHPHDAPFADPAAERLLREQSARDASMDLEFFDRAIGAVAGAASASIRAGDRVSHVGTGEALVHQVASNRRLKDPDGKVGAMRWSSCQDASLRAAPEGLVDPWLKTISFWNGDRLLAVLHYYATHPMSHYGQGGVSCDFCGMARDQIAAEAGGAHLYFTGGAGNIGAGKYNDGSPEMRPVLTARVLEGMRGALASTRKQPAIRLAWSTLPVRLPPRAEFSAEYYRGLLENASAGHSNRYHGATGLAWLNRVQSGHAIEIGCLSINEARGLHLPGEPFVEYQLGAQAVRPDRFVALAGYGDCGPGYLPTATAYEEGGYESGGVALAAPESEPLIRQAIAQLLQEAN